MSLATVQTRLKNAGLYTGEIDGKWGLGSETAVNTAMDMAKLAVLTKPVPKTPIFIAGTATVMHPQYTIESFVQHFIETYEGGLSMDPKDTGNWYRGVLCGSKYGVTAAALADYRHVIPMTPADVAALTESEAIRIGVELYYDRPDFDLLPWNPVTASMMDMGWGAGPGQSIKLAQRMVGANDDGKIGRYFTADYEDYIVEHGLERAALDWAKVRYQFYDQIIAKRPSNAKYRNGWRNRTDGFLPGTAFWKQWNLPASNRSAAA
jgi:lysozyme family protein